MTLARKTGLRRDTPKSREFADRRSELSRGRGKSGKAGNAKHAGSSATPQTRHSSLGRGKRRRLTGVERDAAFLFASQHAHNACVVCGEVPDAWMNHRNDVHHVISQQWLKRNGFAHLLWDPRNGASVCPINRPWGNDCHEKHENASRRIPRSALTRQNHAFGIEVMGDAWDLYVDRYYGAAA